MINSDIELNGFINKNKLESNFNLIIEKWFTGLVDDIAKHHNSAGRTLVIGINGAQGSGKSTLAELLILLFKRHNLTAVTVSMDDFYYTHSQRKQLAETVHPLLQTRGVPGTHDIELAKDIVTKLVNKSSPIKLPRFNKAVDDRLPEHQWPVIEQDIDIVVIEGWCLGSKSQSADLLENPINDLEALHDADRQWRSYVNEQLQTAYPELFAMIDIWIMLKAPSFDCVFDWRLQQENQLRDSLTAPPEQQKLMDEQSIRHFIKFYQRITEHTLSTLPQSVHYLYELDSHRNIENLHNPVIPQIKKAPTRWLIYTDLDGSLLDHFSYQHKEADPVLAELNNQDTPVILVSSKTRAEMLFIRESLNNQHPFIVENGAAVFIPVGYFEQQPEDTFEQNGFWIKTFTEARQRWQMMINALKTEFSDQFTTFADAGIDGIIAMTGLNIHAAAKAARREFGEPVAWHGEQAKKLAFIDRLTQSGAHILQGGRFMHVSGDCDKGKALQWLSKLYQKDAAKTQHISLAIGDSDNDKSMLEQADVALIIPSPVHELPELERQQGCFIAKHPGPAGWAEGVCRILNMTATTAITKGYSHG